MGRQKATFAVIVLLTQLCAITFAILSLSSPKWAYQSNTSPLNEHDVREVEIGVFYFCDSLVSAPYNIYHAELSLCF